MDDPLYIESLVVGRSPGPDGDDDGAAMVDIIGTVAGPAGSSAVEFPDGSVWEVDHARPGQLVQLTVAAAGVAESELVASLIGRWRAGEIAAWLDDPEHARAGRPMRLEADDPRAETSGSPFGTPRRRGRGAMDVGARVLAVDMVGDPGLDPLVRVCAGAEFVYRFDPETSFGLDRLRGVTSMTVNVLATEVTDDDLGELVDADPKTASRVHSLLDDLVASGDGGLPVRSLLDGLRSVMSERYAVSRASLLMDFDAVAAPPIGSSVRPATRSAIREFDEDFQQIEMTQPGLLSVTVARGEGDRWVRVLRREGLILLALAPLSRSGLLDRAELVVPPDLVVDDLVVEIVDAHAIDRVAVGADAIRAAVRAGREAARSERLGDTARARQQWRTCADLWTRAGDDSRASLARAYAKQSGYGFDTGGTVDALVADAVADGMRSS